MHSVTGNETVDNRATTAMQAASSQTHRGYIFTCITQDGLVLLLSYLLISPKGYSVWNDRIRRRRHCYC